MVEESPVIQDAWSVTSNGDTRRYQENKVHKSNDVRDEGLELDSKPLEILPPNYLGFIQSPKYQEVVGDNLIYGDLTQCENEGELNKSYIDEDQDWLGRLSEIPQDDLCQVRPEVHYGDIAVTDSSVVHIGTKNIIYVKQVIAPDEVRSPAEPLPSTEKSKWNWKGYLQPTKKKIYIGVMGTLLLCVIVGIAVALTLTLPIDDEDEPDMPWNLTQRLKTRQDWFAEAPLPDAQKPLLVRPPKYVMVAHTAGSNCTTERYCSNRVRSVQADHIAQGYDDIGYNFLVGGDGFIYEGRGWDYIGAHTIGYNSKTLGLAFIGDFVIRPPPKIQLDAAKVLLEEGVVAGKLDPNYKIIVQKQVKATQSPGDALIDILKTWPHWSLCDDECKKLPVKQ